MPDNGISIADLPEEAQQFIKSVSRLDGWENVATGLGVDSKDHRLSARFKGHREILPQEYDRMYECDPIFARIVDTPPLDATRNWITINIPSDVDTDGRGIDKSAGQLVLEDAKRLKMRARFFELLRLVRLDGGAAMIIGANDGQAPDQPLDLERVESVDFLNVVSRFELNPIEPDSNPASPTFRRPQFFQITASASALSPAVPDTEQARRMFDGKIHHSRVIALRGIRIDDSNVRPTGGRELSSTFWGVPIVQRVYDDLRQYNTIYAYIEAAFKELSATFYGVKDLAELLSTFEGNQTLIARLKMMNFAASVFNAGLFDPDLESVEKRTTTLGGVEGIVTRFQEKLAAAAEIPLTKIFGTAPSGLSTDDNAGTRNFNATIANHQELVLREPITRVLEAIMHADNGPTGGSVPEVWSFTFNPLDEPNEKEQSERRKKDAETDKLYVEAGVLNRSEVRSRLANDPESPYVLEAKEETEDQPVIEPGAGAAGAVAAGGDAQKTALNGAQVTSALEIAAKVTSGELPRESAITMLVSFFNVDRAVAGQIINPIEEKEPEPVPPALTAQSAQKPASGLIPPPTPSVPGGDEEPGA